MSYRPEGRSERIYSGQVHAVNMATILADGRRRVNIYGAKRHMRVTDQPSAVTNKRRARYGRPGGAGLIEGGLCEDFFIDRGEEFFMKAAHYAVDLRVVDHEGQVYFRCALADHVHVHVYLMDGAE